MFNFLVPSIYNKNTKEHNIHTLAHSVLKLAHFLRNEDKVPNDIGQIILRLSKLQVIINRENWNDGGRDKWQARISQMSHKENQCK